MKIPKLITSAEYAGANKIPQSERWSTDKYSIARRQGCIYALYENEWYGDEEEHLFLRISIRTGKILGARWAWDDLYQLARHWGDYDPANLKRYPVKEWANIDESKLREVFG